MLIDVRPAAFVAFILRLLHFKVSVRVILIDLKLLPGVGRNFLTWNAYSRLVSCEKAL